MKDKKKLVYIIIAISFIAVSAIGATYAYFLASGYSNKTSTVSVTADALDEVSCTAADLSMTVTGSDMKQGSSSSAGTLAKTNSSNITCTATKHTTGTTECTMDIKYTPTNVFAKSSNNTKSIKELTLSGAGTSTNGVINIPNYYEVDMATMTSATTLINGFKWIFSSNDTMTYTMTTKFYNYDFNQNSLAGKTYSGKISVENISCTGVSPTYSTITLNANGGSVSQSTKQVINGYTYGTLPNATKSGSTFKGWSELPSGYQQVEYTESSGTQYIDTGFTPNQDTSVELRINALVAGSQDYFGTSTSSNGYVYGFYDGVSKVWDNYNDDVAPNYHDHISGNLLIRKIKNQTNVSDTYNFSYTHPTSTFVAGYTMFLFARQQAGSAYRPTTMQCYEFKIWDDTTLVRDFIPCLNKNTSKYGMCDVANNGTFYGNLGTGNFTGGANAYTTKNTLVTEPGNHTLYAIYE